jgi:hypothetical protein
MSETTGSMGRGVRFVRSAGRAFAPALLACLGLACAPADELFPGAWGAELSELIEFFLLNPGAFCG